MSRATVSKWWRHRLAEGGAGMGDRSPKPRRSPTRTSKRVEAGASAASVEASGATDDLNAHGVLASTVHKILVPHDPGWLAWIDQPAGRAIRRYERSRPGELIHPDVGKAAGIPPGGGPRVRGRGPVAHRRVGCTYLHGAVDERSRVAYVEAHDDEAAAALVEFWERARNWFSARGMTIDAVRSDNGSNFRSRAFNEQRAERAIRHRRTRPYRPRSNGKVERFNRTLADGLLYSFTFRSENERRRRLDRWVHDYNHHRNHTAVGGPPASRGHNVCGPYN